MSEKLFSEGTYVSNPRMPEWGTGKVLEIRDGGNVRVFFETGGEKIMPAASILPTASQEKHPLLEQISNTTKISKVKSTQAKKKPAV